MPIPTNFLDQPDKNHEYFVSQSQSMMDRTKQKCNQAYQLSDDDNFIWRAQIEDNEAEVEDEGVER